MILRASTKAVIVPYALQKAGGSMGIPVLATAFSLSYLLGWAFENAVHMYVRMSTCIFVRPKHVCSYVHMYVCAHVCSYVLNMYVRMSEALHP